MPDPDYLKDGKGLPPEEFQAELDKLTDDQREAQVKERKEARKEAEKKLAEGDPSVIESPMPAKDRGGEQGNVSVGADDTSFGPEQLDPATAGASEESKDANEALLNVQAAGQDVNQGDGSEEDVDKAKDEAKDAVKDHKAAEKKAHKKS
jgi:hypothetical protein